MWLPGSWCSRAGVRKHRQRLDPQLALAWLARTQGGSPSLEPESADQIGRRKADNVLSVRADLLASANPGCTLQIQKILRGRGVKLPAAHPVEILAASIAGLEIGAISSD